MAKKISPELEPVISRLKDFGLTENEAIVYSYLLRRGVEVGGSKIALGAGIHRQYVYLSLKRLMEMGLAESIEHGKQKRYKALSPTQIEKIAKRKVFEAEEIANELNKFSALGNNQEFEIFTGEVQVNNYERDFFASLKENEAQYVISGASQNFLDYFGDEYERLATKGKNKKLQTFYVGGKHEIEYLEKAKKINPHFTYRMLDGMPKGVTSTTVRRNSVVLYSLAKPPLVYVIRSETIAQEYKAYFDMLWNLAKP